jgi:S-formylglutathione hydrolase FrmB
MAHLQCVFYSKALEMDTCVNVILPNEGDLSKTKVVYLLHGLSDNYSAWGRYTSVERYAVSANVAVIMPEVQRSFYCDTVSGMAYFRYISQELPQLCRHFFSLSTDPKQNYIMGLSMGGFGALKCALTYPERYAGCGSFSGALRMDDELLRNVLKKEELAALVGADCKAGSENNLIRLASEAKKLPPIYLSCGEQDRLYPMTVEFAGHLETLGTPHRFDHRPGTHSWEFWDQSLKDCFAYLFA